MEQIDLGFEVPDYGEPMMASSMGDDGEKRKMKKAYPQFTVTDNLELAKSLKAGQELTITCKVRVTEIAIRDRANNDRPSWHGDGTRVEFEVQSMTPEGVRLKEPEEEDGKSALQKFMDGKKKPKPEPEEDEE